MASSIGLLGVPSAPISPNGPIYGKVQENYGSLISNIWKMNKELKNKHVHSNNERRQLQKSSAAINDDL